MHISFEDWAIEDVARMDSGRTQPVLHSLDILGVQALREGRAKLSELLCHAPPHEMHDWWAKLSELTCQAPPHEMSVWRTKFSELVCQAPPHEMSVWRAKLSELL